MLVLKRKRLESILIGNDIRVTVVEVAGGGVRIGIEAPRGVQVDREEIRRSRSLAPRSEAPRPDSPRIDVSLVDAIAS